MARLNKAARGKHRWIGFSITQLCTREELQRIIEPIFQDLEWRLFDVSANEIGTMAIVKVDLNDYKNATSLLNEADGISTITSSGKIRLVRTRLE